MPRFASRWLLRRPDWLAASVLLLGLVIATSSGIWIKQRETRGAQARFERLAERVEREVARRLQLPVYGMHGARGLFEATGHVTLPEFRTYVDSRHLAQEFPGIRGFGLIERVPHEALESYIDARRREGQPDYDVQSLAPGGPHYLIKYIEPLAANRPALGLDLAGDAIRRQAMEQAIDTGHPVISDRLTLRQDASQSVGFLLLVPFYRPGSDPLTIEQRRRALMGVLFAPLVAHEMFEQLGYVTDGQLAVTLYAGEHADAAQLIHRSDPGLHEQDAAFRTWRTLTVAQRQLSVQSLSTPLFEQSSVSLGWLGVAVGGALLSAALAFATWLLASARLRAEALAHAMTADLQRLALVARGTSNAVIATDVQLRINWVNEGFTRITGYSAEEVLGRTPAEVLSSGQAAPETLHTLAEAAREGKGCRVEILNRRKDGRLNWVDTELQPVRDEDGALTGFIEIALDITERKAAAEQLAREQQRLQSIIDGTGAGTWEWGLRQDTVRFNEEWAQMLGYTLADLEPITKKTWERLAHPEDLQRAAHILKEHLRGATAQYEAEMRLRHRDGHWVWVLTRGKVTARDAQGQPLRVAGTHLDISVRKQIEQDLRNSEAVLERAGRIAGVGAWQVELGSQRLHWSVQMFRLHDLDPASPQPSLEEALRFFDADTRERIAAATHALVTEGSPQDLELRLITAQGRSIWVRSVAQPEFEGSRVVRIVGTLQDITERRRLEDSLRRNHDVLRSVLENLPCGLSVFDAQLHLVADNQLFRDLLGFPPQLFEAELRGEPVQFEEIIRFNAQRGEYGESQDLDATVNAIIERARQPTLHQFERTRPDGTVLDIRGAPMPGGGFVTTYIDVTQQRHAAQELAKAMMLQKAVMDASSKVAIMGSNRQRVVNVFNKGAEMMTGYSAAEMIGKARASALFDPVELEAYGREVSAQVGEPLSGFAALVHPSQLGREVECHYVRKDGSSFPALRVVTEMRTPDGELFGYLGVGFDISRLKQTEDELREATAAAEAASAAMGQFLANMSHEIRTPMNAVLGLLQLLQRTPLDERQRDYVSKTERAGRSLLGLLNDILDFSKIEAGKMQVDRHPFSPQILLDDLRVILTGNVRHRPLALHFELDPSLPPALLGDSLRLQQVLINLGGNAIKFTTEGQVRVSLRREPPLAEDPPGSVRLQFRVSDTGIGIDPAHQQKIFEGFTQAEASTTRRFGGTGLGLSISQRLVQLMGGQLQLHSTPGQGSEFFFSLALPEADPASLPAPVASTPAGGTLRLQGLRLLVVEDNRINQQVARELLEDEGATIEVAGNGALALQRLAEDGAFDLVLMDVQMPEMDGYTATRAIRADARLAALPVIAMTANTMEGDREAARVAGMDGHVGKPFEIDELVAVINRRLGRTQSTGAPTEAAAPGRAPVPPALQAQGMALGLDLADGLARLMGRPDRYLRICRGFVEDAAALEARLQPLLDASQWTEAAALLHGLRGLAATVGARRLADLASRCEQVYKKGEAAAPAEVQALLHAASLARDLLPLAQALQPKPAPVDAEQAAFDPRPLREALAALRARLAESDMAAFDQMEQLRPLCESRPELADPFDTLDQSMALLDFVAADRSCQQMLDALPHD
ncbi:PAS domain S-box protein [Mitsuaria sp. WAJ17]|uniref:PAS domain S-box protein n=1 Tax=Mitsuaria sp. WAJ17 TaxID=2761452 RepID=UPI0016022183|nr:PAS domain S-box protein [Mitsuaria sp. WAJ17]MBB2488064.1 PAS domain S-box protein [Mitsuaria sp. WAJ17]